MHWREGELRSFSLDALYIFKMCSNHKTVTFSILFHSHKNGSVSPWVEPSFTTRNDKFPSPTLHIFQLVKSLPLHLPEARKRYPLSGRDCPYIGDYREYTPCQEPVTRSEQPPYVCVTAFSRTSLFLEQFWREFWKSFPFHKPVSKTYRPKITSFAH